MYCKNFHMYGVMIVGMYSIVVFPLQSMINASRVFEHTCIHTMGSHTLTTKYCSYLVCNYNDLLQPAVCFNIIIHTNIIEATVSKSNVTGRCNIPFKFQSVHQQLSEIIFDFRLLIYSLFYLLYVTLLRNTSLQLYVHMLMSVFTYTVRLWRRVYSWNHSWCNMYFCYWHHSSTNHHVYQTKKEECRYECMDVHHHAHRIEKEA